MSALSAPIYNDFQGLANLKAEAIKNSDGAIDEVARQFESLFLQMMLKSMRDASLGDSLMDSDQSLFYRDMFDQQLTLHLAENGGVGLTDVIKRQLGGGENRGAETSKVMDVADYRRQAVVLKERLAANADPKDIEVTGTPVIETGSKPNEQQLNPVGWTKQEFVKNLWPMAKEAASVLGVQPQALIAQAALESGWGQHMIQFANGAIANNLFGIKADNRWQGGKVAVESLEYEGGVAVKRRSRFRAYNSLEESFKDYADFIRSNPRYEHALKNSSESHSYFTELQRAGYATDPDYAIKIGAILRDPAIANKADGLKNQGNMPL